MTYPTTHCAEYSPQTLNEMLDRVPGIKMILQAGRSSNFDGGDRGQGLRAATQID